VSLRIGFVAELGADSPVQRMIVAGLQRASRELGAKPRVLAPGPREEYYASLAWFARRDYDLVFAFGAIEAPAIGRAALRYPRNGGVRLGRISPRVPHRFVRRVDKIGREIASGRIHGIPVTLA
jgi:hypothetical protein